jgi:hypothetical protein
MLEFIEFGVELRVLDADCRRSTDRECTNDDREVLSSDRAYIAFDIDI